MQIVYLFIFYILGNLIGPCEYKMTQIKTSHLAFYGIYMRS